MVLGWFVLRSSVFIYELICVLIGVVGLGGFVKVWVGV